MSTRLLLGAAVAVVLAVLVGTWLAYQACPGTLVRGLLWWTCLP